MSTRWLILVAASGAAGAMACAATQSPITEQPPDESSVVADGGSAADGGADADDPDAGPCSAPDCEFFPETCSADVLCPGGPFDPNNPGGRFDPRTQINVIRGRSSNDVWAAGAVGAVAHFDGTSWTTFDSGTTDSIMALWLRGGGEVAFATLDRPYARGLDVADGGAMPSPDGWLLSPTDGASLAGQADLLSAWAAPGAEWLWGAARTTSSGLWRVRQSPSSPFEVRLGVPAATCDVLGCMHMASIHGASASTLWAVGSRGATVRITNAESDTPSAKAFNSQTWNMLNGVWAASDAEAWAVGGNGTIRRYRGQARAWDVVSDVPTSVDLNAVWGTSASDVWAVGDAGVVLHYDGTSWSRVKVAGLGRRRPNLTTVWAAAPGHVWIGGHGVVLSLGGKP